MEFASILERGLVLSILPLERLSQPGTDRSTAERSKATALCSAALAAGAALALASLTFACWVREGRRFPDASICQTCTCQAFVSFFSLAGLQTCHG